MRDARPGGFTLMELLVVLAILSLLAVALLPTIGLGLDRQGRTETQGRMALLVTAIDAFERNHGFYPPDDFKIVAPDEYQVKVQADRTNAGIESLLIYLCWKRGGPDIGANSGWFGNLDGDDNGVRIPLLDTSEKLEVLDGWGNPLVYFHNHNYGKGQAVMRGVGEAAETVTVRAVKEPKTGGWLSPRKYQLLSAGEDQIYGTEDDIVYPERRR